MAFARDSYTAAAAATDFTISFSYLEEDHVEVQVNGVAQVITTNYTIVNLGATVRFNSGLTSGDIVVITRNTSRDARLVDYVVPGTLDELTLDTDSLQAFYMVQEGIDRAELSLGIDDATDQWDGDSLQIKNLSPGTLGTDAVNKDQLDAVTALTGNVPSPEDPGEDNKTLVASGGTFDWGTLPVAGGGTGGTTASAALTNLGFSSFIQTLIDDADEVTAKETLKTPASIITEVNNADRTVLSSNDGVLFMMENLTADRTVDLLSAAGRQGYTVGIEFTSGSNKVIIDPSGSQTIDGFTTFELKKPGDRIWITSDDSNWKILSSNLAPVTTVFTSSGTFTPTPGRRVFRVGVQGAGGGAGGGGVTANALHTSCGGGGGGGAYAEGTIHLDDLGATETVTIGSGGAGGSGATSGSSGSLSSFGSLISSGPGLFGSSSGAAAGFNHRAGGAGGTNTIDAAVDVVYDKDGMRGFASTAQDQFPAQLAQGGHSFSSYGGHGIPGNADGENAQGVGAGGSGGCNRGGSGTPTKSGGDGGDGYVFVVET